MKHYSLLVLLVCIACLCFGQKIPIEKNNYHFYGPNSNWGQYLVVGGNGHTSDSFSSVVTTNGNLHLDSKKGHSIYLNYYTKGNTLLNTQGGLVGIGTYSPQCALDIKGSVNLNNTHSAAAGYLNPGYYVYKHSTTAYGMKLQYTDGQYGTMIFGPNQNSRFISFGKVGAKLTDDNMKEYMRLDLDNGNVLIGEKTVKESGYKLEVVGNIKAEEIKIEAKTADFVFEKDYHLLSLKEVSSHIKEKHHLPGIPSAKQMQKEGTDLATMNQLLLQKVEELTLYIIEQDKKIDRIESALEKVKVD